MLSKLKDRIRQVQYYTNKITHEKFSIKTKEYNFDKNEQYIQHTKTKKSVNSKYILEQTMKYINPHNRTQK